MENSQEKLNVLKLVKRELRKDENDVLNRYCKAKMLLSQRTSPNDLITEIEPEIDFAFKTASKVLFDIEGLDISIIDLTICCKRNQDTLGLHHIQYLLEKSQNRIIEYHGNTDSFFYKKYESNIFNVQEEILQQYLYSEIKDETFNKYIETSIHQLSNNGATEIAKKLKSLKKEELFTFK